MSYDLVVTDAFDPYKVGDKIIDQTIVAQIQASVRVHYVVQILHISDDIDTVAPTILTTATLTVAENAAFSVALTASEAVTWTKTGGADAALFTLTGATLSMSPRDFEAPTDANGDNAYVVTVTATDAAGNATAKTLTVTVTDVAEGTPPSGGAMDFSAAANSGLIAAIAA